MSSPNSTLMAKAFEYQHAPWLFLVLGAAWTFFLFVAIWVGVSRSPAWYWRWAVVFLGPLALILVEAYEPAALLLIAMPMTSLTSFALCRKSLVLVDSAMSSSSGVRWCFSLRDMLLTVLFSGIAFAIFAVLLQRLPSIIQWVSLLIQASALAGLSATLSALILSRVRWLTAIVFALCCLWAYVPHVSYDGLGIKDYFIPVPEGQTADYWLWTLIPGVAVLALLLVLLRGSHRPSNSPESRTSQWIRSSARFGLAIVACALLLPVAWTYVQLFHRAQNPADAFPRDNSLPRVIMLVEDARPEAIQEAAIVEDLNHPEPELAKRLRALDDKALQFLEAEGYVQLQHTSNPRGDYDSHLDKVVQPTFIRGIGRRWISESRLAATNERFKPAVDYALATARLGAYQSRGGLLIDSLIGISNESKGLGQLAELRREIPIGELRELIGKLDRLDRVREPPEVTITRELAYVDRAFTWRRRLDIALYRLRGQPDGLINEIVGDSFYHATKRPCAILRLLMTELALRLHFDVHRQFPISLDDLVPEYLAAIPTDPYSQRPFVFRRTNDSYVLYSVGRDGKDNGGSLPQQSLDLERDGFDLDLDTPQRLTARPGATLKPTSG